MPLGYTNVYYLKEGQSYADVQKFCPNDGYELTRADEVEPRKIWYIDVSACPIDAVQTATLTTVQNQVLPMFNALQTLENHQKRVWMAQDLSYQVISQWMLSNPAFLPEHASFLLDRGNVHQMIYNELVRQGLVSELTTMDPPQ
jgi:hypothetical protein